MVDFQRVSDRLLKGLYTGVGVVFADDVQDFLSARGGLSGALVPVGGAAIGLGVSVFADDVTDMLNMRRAGAVNDIIEFGGYGIQGASYNNLLESMMRQAQQQRVTVSHGSPSMEYGQQEASQRQQVPEEEEPEILLDSP